MSIITQSVPEQVERVRVSARSRKRKESGGMINTPQPKAYEPSVVFAGHLLINHQGCEHEGVFAAVLIHLKKRPKKRAGRIKHHFIDWLVACPLIHYIDANYQTEKRVNKLWEKLEKWGIDKTRLQLAWISAAEGEKFADKAKEIAKIVKKVSKDEIDKTAKILKAERQKREALQKKLAASRAERKAAEETGGEGAGVEVGE